ncbi:TRAP transporter small permease [Maritalea sp. S77]|jgi:TRAP-type C4-dicarboxylate transport system permease small subunit|uniref:TRAP transporter small permease n=1 Tax=Maritalea sp. S77 TaxID=3415125 RepID=UPI003C7EA815
MSKQHHTQTKPPVFPAAYAIEGFFKKLTELMAYIGIGALILAIIVVVGDIIWRRVGGGSFIGAVDLTQFSLVAAAAWSIPFAFANHNHVTVDLLSDVFPVQFKRMLDAIAALCGAGLTGFLLWLCWGRAMEIFNYGDVSQDLALPLIIPWAFLLSGLLISCLVSLVNAAIFLTVKERIYGE